MTIINAQTFNPEIVYAFDCWNETGVKCEDHTHDFTEISIILEGESLYTIEGKSQTLKANTVMVFNPGVNHREEQVVGTYSHQLHIGIKNFNFLGYEKDSMPNKKTILIPQVGHHVIMEVAWQLVNELSHEVPEYRVMTKTLVMQLMVLIIRSLESSQGLSLSNVSPSIKRRYNLVEAALHYMEQHYDQDLTVDQIAQELLISPAYLSKIFKEIKETSIINYLIEVRMKQAAVLIRDSKRPIKEVAEIVGYQDPLYFSKQFKKYYGEAPTHFKKSE